MSRDLQGLQTIVGQELTAEVFREEMERARQVHLLEALMATILGGLVIWDLTKRRSR